MGTLVKSMTAYEAKTHFGQALVQAQTIPVQVTKNGKPMAMIISIEEFNATEELKKQLLTARLQQGLQEIKAGNLLSEDEVFQGLLAE